MEARTVASDCVLFRSGLRNGWRRTSGDRFRTGRELSAAARAAEQPADDSIEHSEPAETGARPGRRPAGGNAEALVRIRRKFLGETATGADVRLVLPEQRVARFGKHLRREGLLQKDH